MKILVLGNGFDLDHNLPTGYKNFLYFCLYITKENNKWQNYYEKLTPIQKKYVKTIEQKKKIKAKFISLLENNNLLRYFEFRLEQQGDNWIDLEREIKSIVQELESIEKEYVLSKKNWYTANGEHRIYETLDKLGLDNIAHGKINEISLNLIHSALQKSLRDFCKALELYIVTFINSTPIDGVSPDIIDFDATDVITFNYSNTYERVYSGVHWRENIDHVHGVACESDSDETNIVLGITSVTENKEINRYVDFEKYFQRITKKTENTYKKWLRSKLSDKGTIDVVFFGHSLDASDSDIIKDLICHENTKIVIYYYNDIAYQNIVANLIEILDKKTMLEYTYGESPKISFKPQKKHQHNNTAGVEIERDVRKLYKLYSLKNKEVYKLIDKLRKKMREARPSYFYSQRKTIDLFEALKYIELDSVEKETFFEICKPLDFEVSKGGNLIRYNYDEWYSETPWDQTLPCSDITKELIDLVNDSNAVRFEEMKAKKPYAYFHSLSTVEEIKSELIKVIQEEPSDEYWKNLNRLMYEMVENDLFEKAVKLIDADTYPIPINSKIKHFCMAYYETIYDYNMQKQWEEEQKNNKL